MGGYGFHFWMTDISRNPEHIEEINSHSFDMRRLRSGLGCHRFVTVGYGGCGEGWGGYPPTWAEGGSSLPRTCRYYQSDPITLRLPADYYNSKGIPRTPIYARFYLMLHEVSLRQRRKLHLPLCYTSGINTHEGTGKATAEALLRS